MNTEYRRLSDEWFANADRWLANLAIARTMMEKLPPEKVNLKSFRDPDEVEGEDADYSLPPTCGTICCFGGWCAWEPAFMAQGIFAEGSMGVPVLARDENESVPRYLFGDYTLFFSRSVLDELDGAPYDCTDRDVVLRRIDARIAKIRAERYPA